MSDTESKAAAEAVRDLTSRPPKPQAVAVKEALTSKPKAESAPDREEEQRLAEHRAAQAWNLFQRRKPAA